MTFSSAHVQQAIAEPAESKSLRQRLLAGVPVTEMRGNFAGISTAFLTGGDGPPLVLLHGPGESSVNWRWVIPELVRDFRVIAPDLPAHGSSDAGRDELDADRVLAWLGELIAQTCDSPPVLVGHVLGGSIAARFAISQGSHVRRIVLVDSLGLGRFQPSMRFAFRFIAFAARPTARTYTRFMSQCAYDLDSLRSGMHDWDAFAAYNLELARSPNAKAASRLFKKLGVPRIPPEDLARIEVPTSLIWGRQDRALPLKIAERVSAAYGWPLHVIEEAADDPPRDQPAAFINALRAAIANTGEVGRDFALIRRRTDGHEGR